MVVLDTHIQSSRSVSATVPEMVAYMIAKHFFKKKSTATIVLGLRNQYHCHQDLDGSLGMRTRYSLLIGLLFSSVLLNETISPYTKLIQFFPIHQRYAPGRTIIIIFRGLPGKLYSQQRSQVGGYFPPSDGKSSTPFFFWGSNQEK